MACAVAAFQLGLPRAYAQEGIPSYSPLSPVVVSNPQGREACREGRAAVKDGRRREALAALRRGIDLDPGLLECRVVLATLLLREYRWAEAELQFRTAIELNEDPARETVLWVGLGEALERGNHREEAVQCYERALQLDPTSRRALGHLAIARRAAGDLQGALDAWHSYLEERPGDGAAIEHIEEIVRLKVELQLLGEQVAGDDADAEAWAHLARTRRAAIDLEGALEARKRAVGARPDDAALMLAAAVAAIEASHPDEARKFLERTVRLDPKRTAAYAHLARLEELRGNSTRERKVWERLLEQHPLDLIGLGRWVELVQLEERLESAERRVHRQAIEEESGAGLVLKLALLRQASGDRAGAREVFTVALERLPNNPAIHTALRSFLRTDGAMAGRQKRTRSAASLREPVTRGPQPTALGTALLDCFKAQGPAESLKALKALIAEAVRHPTAVGVRVILGDALGAVGRPEDARLQYIRALEMEPDYAFASLALALLEMREGRPEKALQWAGAVLKEEPDHLYALATRALASSALEDFGSAERAARAALAIDPWERTISTRLMLAHVLTVRGDLRAAEDVVRGELPRSGWLMYDLAWSFALEVLLEDPVSHEWGQWRRRAGALPGDQERALSEIARLLSAFEDRYTRLRTPEQTLEKYFWRRPDSPELRAGRTNEANRSVIARLLDENLAYLKLADFQTPRLAAVVREILAQLGDSSALVLDLRGNPGGLKDEARKVAELLVQPDTLLGVEQRRGGSDEIRAGPDAGLYSEAPIVVLVDENTASAAEALARMLQSTGRATIMGDVTRGKGVSQAVRLLPGGYSLLVTASRSLDASGRPLDSQGVVPEITPEEGSGKEDPALQKAREWLQPEP
ncbi:MAG: S41 family peptidase [Acidobacteriota bacterium]